MGRRRHREFDGHGPIADLDLEALVHELQGGSQYGNEQPVTPDAAPPRQRMAAVSGSLAIGRLVEGDVVRKLQDHLIQIAGSFGFRATSRVVHPGVAHIAQAKMQQMALEQPGLIKYTDADELLHAMQAGQSDAGDPAEDGLSIFDSYPVSGHIVLAGIKKQAGAGQRLRLELRGRQVAAAMQTEHDLVMDMLEPYVDHDSLSQTPRSAAIIPILNLRRIDRGADMRRLLAAPLPVPHELELGPLTTFQSMSEDIAY